MTRSGRGEPGGSFPNLSKQVVVVKPTVERASASREYLFAVHIPPGCGLNTSSWTADVTEQARGGASLEGGAVDGERDVAGSGILVPMTKWRLVRSSW